MTLPEITAAIQSIKTGIKIAKGFSDFKTEYEIKSATSELLDSIIDVQNNPVYEDNSTKYCQEPDALPGTFHKYSISELEKKLIELENWNKTKLDYSLVEISSGVFVYVSNESKKSGNKQPWFCAKCFNTKILSPFQRKYPNHEDYVCHSCGSKIQLPEKNSPPHRSNRPILP